MMRWTLDELWNMPSDYYDVLVEMLNEEAAEARKHAKR